MRTSWIPFIAFTLIGSVTLSAALQPSAEAMLVPASDPSTGSSVHATEDLDTIQSTLESKILREKLHALGTRRVTGDDQPEAQPGNDGEERPIAPLAERGRQASPQYRCCRNEVNSDKEHESGNHDGHLWSCQLGFPARYWHTFGLRRHGRSARQVRLRADLILGMFMVATIPLTYPIIAALGIDPIWYGVFIVLMCELGLITPPVGMNLFVVHGIRPDRAVSRTRSSALCPMR